MQTLTHSQLQCLRSCPRKHYLRYILRLSRIREQEPLRIGRAYHRGIETASIELAVAEYTDPSLELEKRIVETMLSGRFWRYQNDDVEILHSEIEFSMPLVNPETGAASRSFEVRGKIDAIGYLPERRPAVIEYKTCGEDIGDESEYWPRLRCDSQISIYVLGARELARAGNIPAEFSSVNTILYDVARKPSIAPKQIAVLDEQGRKIVIDAAGERIFKKDGTPRESASTEYGWTLKTNTETPEQFAERFLADIGERPDFYFARREVPRLESDLDECRLELWQQSKLLLNMRRSGGWFRNVGRWSCQNCEFRELCFQNIQVNPDAPPVGYSILADAHPELQEN